MVCGRASACSSLWCVLIIFANRLNSKMQFDKANNFWQEHFGFLDRIEHRTLRTALDVLVKILYSVILLSSNIFILDIVADVRMIQVLCQPCLSFCLCKDSCLYR
jgi:hypothetical protein